MLKPCFFLLTLLCLIASAHAADGSSPSISTTGESTVYVTPDQVIINLGIETFGSTVDEATGENQKQAEKLLPALKALGIDEKYIQTDNLNLEIRYTSGDERRIAGYTARRSYSVKLKDVTLFEKTVETALKNGANQLEGISFQTTDLRKYRDQARQMAVKAAKEKAVALAGELDCKVGLPHTITEGGNYSYFGGSYWGGNYNMMSQNSMQSMPAQPDASETLPLGQIAVSASVSVTFDLK